MVHCYCDGVKVAAKTVGLVEIVVTVMGLLKVQQYSSKSSKSDDSVSKGGGSSTGTLVEMVRLVMEKVVTVETFVVVKVMINGRDTVSSTD